MLFDLFTKSVKLLLKQRKEDIAGDADLLQIRKRQLLHKSIPSLAEIKRLSGDRFDQLQQIFIKYDPIKTEALSAYPDKYQLLTKTVIYRLPRQKTAEAVADLLFIDFSLWFRHAYNDFDKKEQLADEVFSFKKINFPTDPFQAG